MKSLVTIILILISVFQSSLFAESPDDVKKLVIDELFEVRGLGRMPYDAYLQWKNSDPQFQQLQKQFPQIVSADYETLFKQLYEVDMIAMKKVFTGFLNEKFNLEELKQINAFYTSSTGRKVLASIPELFSRMTQTDNSAAQQPLIKAWVAQVSKKYDLH